jgi:hypothetical protein
MTDAKQGRGRPAKPGKTTFNFRISADLRQMLVAAATKSGLSLTEEAELRLRRDFGWEAAKGDIEELKRQALVWADASRAKAIRDAGLQILREIEGNPKRVIVDLETLLAEADGIARGYRAGWEPEHHSADDRPLTKEEADRVLAQIDEIGRRTKATKERLAAEDAAAAAADTNPWRREMKGRKVTVQKKSGGLVVSRSK